jgi:hypothetical protein
MTATLRETSAGAAPAAPPEPNGAARRAEREARGAAETARVLAAELAINLAGEVRFDRVSRMLYSTDASNYQIEPIGVVLPKTSEDVLATVELAASHGVPLLPRGGGSSLAGQTVGTALVVDFSKYLNRVLAIDPEARTVTNSTACSNPAASCSAPTPPPPTGPPSAASSATTRPAPTPSSTA